MFTKDQLKTVDDFAAALKLAVEVIEKTAAVEERARGAEIRQLNAEQGFYDTLERLEKWQADHEAEFIKREQEHEKRVHASLEALADHTKKHQAIIENANEQVELAMARLQDLQRQIRDGIAMRDNLNTEVAAAKAKLTDSLAKL